MLRLARAAIAHPRLALGLVGLLIGGFALAGLGVEDRLHRTPLIVDGTESEEATQLLVDRFGDIATLAVMLEGPPGALDREGPRVAERLDDIPSTTVLTPWMRGSGTALRDAPDRALIILSGQQDFELVSRETVPAAREVLDEHVPAPIEARMTGTPDIAQGVHGDTVDALRQAELIAAPIMLIVLLLVFRSPVAAAIPLFLGLATVGAGRGLLSVINEFIVLDAGALNMASMMGLALGIDYSLVLVSRFREELAGGMESRAAALVAVRTAGRTVLFAGLALGLAMSVAALVAPGELLASASIGAVVAATLSVTVGLVAVPAVLVLLGQGINRWSWGRPATDSRFAGWALRALRRPAVAAATVLALVLVLAAPSAGLETGPPDPRVLSASSPERNDYEAIADALGPGWSAPYEIVVATEEGTVTEPKRLEALAEWERHLASLDGVAAVYGPGPVAEGAERIERAAGDLERAGQAIERGRRDGE
ncbi:MAG TPA: MMPL family transporter, partial [Solirubrobacterales bacterium]|nr:MMPL family transporter [Solirubrobacterales bacterium]